MRETPQREPAEGEEIYPNKWRKGSDLNPR